MTWEDIHFNGYDNINISIMPPKILLIELLY